MRRKGWLILSGCLAAILLAGLQLFLSKNAADASGAVSGPVLSSSTTLTVNSVEGVVRNPDGPLAGAEVRVRATDNFTLTAADGSFTLAGLTTGITLPITAWYDGYYISQTLVIPPAAGITLTLSPYPTSDNSDYPWIYPHRADSPPEVDFGCDTCHTDVIVAQWEVNAHALAARDRRFLSLYNGTDLTGTQTIAPGYLLDFPGTAGNCATCHSPGAAVDAPFSTNMNTLTPPETDGVFCDFCHKIGGAYLNPITGLPYPNMPGVLSIDLRRPPDGQQMFFGPFTDVPDPDTYLPMIKQSQFCAACHTFSFWGTPIYQSFAEWLASPYAAEGVHCQNCHMAPDGVTSNFAPGEGGFERDPMTIATHLQPGASDVELLQNTVTMTLSTRQVVDQIEVTVTITNTGAGHHVPTDHPGRHMIVVVRLADDRGNELSQLSGTVVPDWGGAQAGLPGVVFAKVLQDAESGRSPVVSYWKQTLVVSDNRIPAMGSDTSSYAFAMPNNGGLVTITVELRFRRVFQALIDKRGWIAPDIIMESVEEMFFVQSWQSLYIPLVANGK